VRILVDDLLELFARRRGTLLDDAKLSYPGCAGTPAGRTGVSKVRTAVESSALAFSSCELT
jgi:hypothetical protein